MLLGLIVHAAADGLAVGVASVSPSIKLAVGVGMAMVLHKGPVAFGLGSFLVSQKLDTATVIKVCCTGIQHRACISILLSTGISISMFAEYAQMREACGTAQGSRSLLCAGCRAVCKLKPHRGDLHIHGAGSSPLLPIGIVCGTCSAVLCRNFPVCSLCAHAAAVAHCSQPSSSSGRCSCALHYQLVRYTSPLGIHKCLAQCTLLLRDRVLWAHCCMFPCCRLFSAAGEVIFHGEGFQISLRQCSFGDTSCLWLVQPFSAVNSRCNLCA